VLPQVGGQCAELYADKPIYDIPALPVSTGRELIERLQRQIAPMGAEFHLGQEVTRLTPRTDRRFEVETSAGLQFNAGCVFIAAGVGAFRPRRLAVQELARFEGTQLWYHAPPPAAWAGRKLVIVGGGDEALDAVIRLAGRSGTPDAPASLTLVHRRDHFQAEASSIAELARLRDTGAVQFVAGQITGAESIIAADGQARLGDLQITGGDGAVQTLPADVVWVRLGLVPQLGPIAQWGVALERKLVVVDTEKFETSVPGIYAIGDVNSYPGKKKLIVCGFHEATLAAYAAAAHLWPERRIQLEYTTSSKRLHKLLGVDTPGD
jgi:thioredoxin reductase (NADPH)